MFLTRPVAGFAADAALSGPISWNAMACEALLFKLGPEYAPDDGFIRRCSQGSESGRNHQALLVRAVQQSNLDKR